MNTKNNGAIQAAIAKGWKPNNYLTNLSMAFFANPADFVATKIFPICPVTQSASYYYKFSKADLARDNVSRKPAFGKVQPAVMGQTDEFPVEQGVLAESAGAHAHTAVNITVERRLRSVVFFKIGDELFRRGGEFKLLRKSFELTPLFEYLLF